MPNFLFSAYLSVGEESKQTRLTGMGDPARRTKKRGGGKRDDFLPGGRRGEVPSAGIATVEGTEIFTIGWMYRSKGGEASEDRVGGDLLPASESQSSRGSIRNTFTIATF